MIFTENFEAKAESAESKPEKAEGVESAESSGPKLGFVPLNEVFGYIVKQLWLFPVGVIASIIVFFYIRKNQDSFFKKSFYVAAPILIAIIILYIYYAPKPRSHYFLSVLFGDKPIVSDFKHKVGKTWPFLGSAVLTMNDNNYIFVGGGQGQDDALLLYNKETKKFDNVIKDYNISSKEATFSAVSIDINGDGLNDLIVGRSDGVTLYKQTDNKTFKKIKILGKKDKVPLALSVSDYNLDGRADIYVSYDTLQKNYRGSVFNDPSHNRQNILLKNKSSSANDISFVDVTKKTKSGGKHNTFTSAFVDFNNDNYPDLIVSNDNAEIEILENKGGKEFKTTHPHNLKGNWMGIGVGDVDQDGIQDVFLTNLGEDIDRDKLSKGDIRPDQKQAFAHVLLQNDGNFKFLDIIKKSGTEEMSKGFGWGSLLVDLNNDSLIDIIFGENFMLNPSHWLFGGVGRQFNQTKDGKFKRKFQYNNKGFGQTPMHVDIDRDGIKDVIWINMGGNVRAYLNKNEENNNYINVMLPETTEFLNAKVVLETTSGKKFYKEMIQGGPGFGGDSQTGMIAFGLGKKLVPKEIRVHTIKGKKYSVKGPKINSTLLLKELRREK